MWKLRNYQNRLIEDARRKMVHSRRIILQLMQGGGKSVIIAFITQSATERNNKVLILSHRREITGQNGNIIRDLNIPMQVIDADTKRIDPYSRCYVSMAQTMMRRLQGREGQIYRDLVKSCGVVIIDEAHLQYSDYIFDHVAPDAYVLGLTGTPVRNGMQTQLALLYKDIVYGVKASELIDKGYIVRARCFTFVAPKLDNVEWNYSSGDWNQRQLAKAFEKKERYRGALKEWQRICPDAKTIIFTTSAKHCIDLCMEFCKAGVNAKYLLSSPHPDTDGKYSGERDDILRRFDEGEIQVLVNIDMLGVGYNCPGIECVILDMATMSYANYAQKAGRGSRSSPGKEFYYLLDFGGNIARHGRPDDDREFSLWHSTSKGGGVVQVKECPVDKTDIHGRYGCGRLIPISAKECPFCGHYFATEREIYEVELTELVDRYDKGQWDMKTWCAQKVLEGWSVPRILMNVCIRNLGNEKKACMEAIKYLRTKDGKPLSPQYWYFFKKNVWEKHVKAKRNSSRGA